MSDIKYLVLDAEMGGRGIEFSLLTVCFLVVDSSFNQLDELYLPLKPDDDKYILSGSGMGVNKIDLQHHDSIAFPYKHAKSVLYEFLKKHGKEDRLVPVGHGVKGDISHIQDKLISEGSWNQFCTYHFLDTSVILQFLRSCGKMPLNTDGSIKALIEYFSANHDFLCKAEKIIAKKGWHNAETDAKMTALVLEEFIKLGTK